MLLIINFVDFKIYINHINFKFSKFKQIKMKLFWSNEWINILLRLLMFKIKTNFFNNKNGIRKQNYFHKTLKKIKICSSSIKVTFVPFPWSSHYKSSKYSHSVCMNLGCKNYLFLLVYLDYYYY